MFQGMMALRQRWKAWLDRQRKRRESGITIDELGVRHESDDGSFEQVLWTEIDSIDIVTTDEGPFAEDVFWVLRAGDHVCVVPGSEAEPILQYSNHFPGWDTVALVQAMRSTQNARFVVRRRTPSRTPG